MKDWRVAKEVYSPERLYVLVARDATMPARTPRM